MKFRFLKVVIDYDNNLILDYKDFDSDKKNENPEAKYFWDKVFDECGNYEEEIEQYLLEFLYEKEDKLYKKVIFLREENITDLKLFLK